MTPSSPPSPAGRFAPRRVAAALALGVVVAPGACDDSPTEADGPGVCDGPVSGELCLRRVADGFEFPLHLTSAPGHDWAVIVEQPGVAWVLEDGRAASEPFLDLRDRVRYPHEQGLLGLEFAPDFAASGVVYANYTAGDGRTQLARFRTGADPRQADPASEERLLTIPAVHGLHNAGRAGDGGAWNRGWRGRGRRAGHRPRGSADQQETQRLLFTTPSPSSSASVSGKGWMRW